MPQRQTILLVDDSENDLALMRVGIQKGPCSLPLQEVRNGEEAIAYLSGEGLYGDREKFPLPTVSAFGPEYAKKGRIRRSKLGARSAVSQAFGDHCLTASARKARHRPGLRFGSDFLPGQTKQLGNIGCHGSMLWIVGLRSINFRRLRLTGSYG
jgi:hypothetical protein